MRPKLICALFVGLWALSSQGAERPLVQVTESPAAFIISNAVVAARINKASGEFSLNYQGQEVITRGYWSQVGRSSVGDIARFGSRRSSAITLDPTRNDAGRGE